MTPENEQASWKERCLGLVPAGLAIAPFPLSWPKSKRADWRFAMQPEKRVRIMLPLRLQRESDPPPRKKIAVCTFDVSEHGVRITGLQDALQSGEIVFLERGNNRAKY